MITLVITAFIPVFWLYAAILNCIEMCFVHVGADAAGCNIYVIKGQDLGEENLFLYYVIYCIEYILCAICPYL